MKKTISIILLLVAFQCKVSAQSKVAATKLGDRIEITINGNLFTSYILSEFEKYPFFYPLNGLSNASVTSMRIIRITAHSSLVVTK
jgi:hypothetical protein